MNEILVIGLGVEGSNVERRLQKLNPDRYDKNKKLDTRVKDHKYEMAFICVDTPYINEENPCDLSQVRSALYENEADLFIIKSTVLPGDTNKLRLETGKNIIFSPEYHGGTQHSEAYEFNFTILGGNISDCIKVIQKLQHIYDARHEFKITDSKTAEMVKYMENAYLAMKVSFCNQFFNMSEEMGICYEELRELFILDPRIEKSHTFVYRDKPYWQSHCFDKDVRAIAEFGNAELLKSVIEFNEKQKNLK